MTTYLPGALAALYYLLWPHTYQVLSPRSTLTMTTYLPGALAALYYLLWPHTYQVLSPRLLAPLADLRPGDFAVHLAGCIGRRERPRWSLPSLQP